MNCNCGSKYMTEHKVVRNKETVGEFQECPSCGRIYWWKKTPELDAEIKADQAKRYDKYMT